MKESIRILGTNYNREDMMVDLVEWCHGISITDNDGFMHVRECGSKYKDGVIVDCFAHFESDSVWYVVKCGEVYFEVLPDEYKSFETFYDPLPFK